MIKLVKCPFCNTSSRNTILLFGKKQYQQYQLVDGIVKKVNLKIQQYKCKSCNKYYLEKIPIATSEVVIYLKELRHLHNIQEIMEITKLTRYTINKILSI